MSESSEGCVDSPVPSVSCADPESFVRGGPTLTTFFFFFAFCISLMGEELSKYHHKRLADYGPILNAGL